MYEMSSKTTAIILIVFGTVVLAYSGITFRMRNEPLTIGPLQVEARHRGFIPPVVGMVVLIGGLVLLVTAPKQG